MKEIPLTLSKGTQTSNSHTFFTIWTVCLFLVLSVLIVLQQDLQPSCCSKLARTCSSYIPQTLCCSNLQTSRCSKLQLQLPTPCCNTTSNLVPTLQPTVATNSTPPIAATSNPVPTLQTPVAAPSNPVPALQPPVPTLQPPVAATSDLRIDQTRSKNKKTETKPPVPSKSPTEPILVQSTSRKAFVPRKINMNGVGEPQQNLGGFLDDFCPTTHNIRKS